MPIYNFTRDNLIKGTIPPVSGIGLTDEISIYINVMPSQDVGVLDFKNFMTFINQLSKGEKKKIIVRFVGEGNFNMQEFIPLMQLLRQQFIECRGTKVEKTVIRSSAAPASAEVQRLVKVIQDLQIKYQQLERQLASEIQAKKALWVERDTLQTELASAKKNIEVLSAQIKDLLPIVFRQRQSGVQVPTDRIGWNAHTFLGNTSQPQAPQNHHLGPPTQIASTQGLPDLSNVDLSQFTDLDLPDLNLDFDRPPQLN